MNRGLTRREFAARAGSGLFVFISAGAVRAYQEPARLPQRGSGYPSDLNAYLRIAPDGKVTCFVGKVELGQGAMTSLAQMLAEELSVAYESVSMVMGDTELCPYDMGTFGSMCTPIFGPVLRRAGAEAKATLVALAAEQLKAPADRLQAAGGVVTDPVQQKKVTYGALVEGKRIEKRVDGALHTPAQFAVMGHSPRRKDGLEKVTGKARYAGDITQPGMLCARIVRGPAHGAKLKSADTSAAEKVPGVRVVRDGDLVAVLHERRDVADRALGLVKAEFERPPAGPDDRTIFAHIVKNGPQPRVVAEAGSIAEGEASATVKLEATYLNSYVAHAPMETHSVVAAVAGEKATVWASTQAPFSVRPAVAQALGFKPENVRVITPYVGGGFGGKSGAPQAAEAARLAKAVGRPVQVVWDRAEEFFFDTFRPAATMKIRSGLNASGKIAFWEFEVVGAGEREAKTFYDVAHQRTTSAGGWQGGNPAGMHPFAVGPWRAPSVNSNSFARESHMDMLAAKAGADPAEFRLRHLTDARLRRVLETALKQSGWRAGKAPSGRGAGVACGVYSNACVATVAEVAVDRKSGAVQVKRVVSAVDAGVIVNPDGALQQIEGAITMGLGQALTEEVRFASGEVKERNFDSYAIPRFSWLPKIEVTLIDNPSTPQLGLGEPPMVTIAPAIANAIFDATGARVNQLPMTRERVVEAVGRAAR